MKLRLSVTTVAVFGVAGLIALAVGIVLYLGVTSAFQNTRRLMTDVAEQTIETMERAIEVRLHTVTEQADWIADYVKETSDPTTDLSVFDEFMLGTLAATPQVAGFTIVTKDGISRRWTRANRTTITEDWSKRTEIVNWIADASTRTESQWIDPFFTGTIDQTVLLHDRPLFDSRAQFIGVLGQIIPVKDLSRQIANLNTRTGMVPFILFDKDKVLAHPKLVSDATDSADQNDPLPSLSDLGDSILERIWTPEETDIALLEETSDLISTGIYIESQQRFFVFLYRNIQNYGPATWTVGAYLNTDLYGGAEGDRLIRSLIGGIVVLLLASLIAVWLGRRFTRPILAIADAARLVEAERFEDVRELPPSRIREIDVAARSINQMVRDLKERRLIRETLGRFVPEQIARNLLSDGGSLEPEVAEATLLYSDIEDFTGLTESLGPTKVVEVLNTYFSVMVEILERHDGVVTQFQGDAILATFNVPVRNENHATNAIVAASEMLSITRTRDFNGQKIQIRIGINTGSIVAGAVGAAGRLNYTVHGDPVNLAARLEVLNKEYGTRLLFSEKSANHASGIAMRQVGETEIRGQSTSVKLFTTDSD